MGVGVRVQGCAGLQAKVEQLGEVKYDREYCGGKGRCRNEGAGAEVGVDVKHDGSGKGRYRDRGGCRCVGAGVHWAPSRS